MGERFILKRDGFHPVLFDQLIDCRRIAAPDADLPHLKIGDRRTRSLDIAEIRVKYSLLGRQVYRARGRMETGRIAAVDLACQHQRVERRFQ